MTHPTLKACINALVVLNYLFINFIWFLNLLVAGTVLIVALFLLIKVIVATFCEVIIK